MNRIKKSTAGFTLIELMIVVIIVAVLAAVGIPLLSGNVERAKLTEADAGLGTIRTALRAKVAEVGSAPAADMTNDVLRTQLNFKAGDLTGRYFGDGDYSYKFVAAAGTTPAGYCLNVEGNHAKITGDVDAVVLANKRSQVAGIFRSMDQNGTIYKVADCVPGATVNGVVGTENVVN